MEFYIKLDVYYNDYKMKLYIEIDEHYNETVFY